MSGFAELERRVTAPWLALACAAAAVFVLTRAWVADDAFITYRVIDNLANGHGLRWNVDERVQVFTHPLWALLHLPLRVAGASLPWAGLALSLLCVAGALQRLARLARLDRLRFLIVVVVPLAVSRAVTDFAFSGLENPLTFLLLAAFAGLALSETRSTPWLGLGMVVSLLALNRLDTLLLVGPCLAALLLLRRRELAWTRLTLGLLPLLLWELFSLLYYGFPFPNTKYAKLDTGIAAADLAVQGLRYLEDFVRRDPQSALLLLVALALTVGQATRAASARMRRDAPGDWERAVRLGALGLGMLLYVVYTVAIGGDFMSGRFFSAPVFLAVILIAADARRIPLGGLLAGAVVLIGATLATAPQPATPKLWWGIADERRVFAQTTSLLDPRHAGIRGGAHLEHPWSRDGRRMAQEAQQSQRAGGRFVVVRGAVGMLGYAAGPEVVVVDQFALSDALLARLPVTDPKRWRVGHFSRAIPEGYLHARATDDLTRMDPDLRRYYERLRLVVAGPLLSVERLREIVRFNLGANDGLRDRYLARPRGPAPRAATAAAGSSDVILPSG